MWEDEKLEDLKERIYGLQIGEVTDNNDPEGRGRVKVMLYWTAEETQETDWLLPAFPPLLWSVPQPGDKVIVGFINGDPNLGVWLGLYEPKEKGTTKEFRIKTPQGYEIFIKENEILIDCSGNKVQITQDGKINITASSEIQINAKAKVKVNATQVELGDAQQFVNNLPSCIFSGAPHSTQQKVKA